MKKIILSLVAVALLAPALSLAAYWHAGESVSITAVQSLEENAYVAGSSVTVSGDVDGDLFAAGNTVSVSGDVSGDIMVAGSLVNIIGASAEDLRAAGSSVNISGNFSGELMAAGAQVIVTSDAEIGEDVRLAGSVLDFNGQAGGDVSLFGEQVTIGAGAVIEGDLNYSSPTEATIDPAAQISGEVNFTETAAGQHKEGAGRALSGFFTAFFVIKFLAVLLVAYLLWYLRRKDSIEIIQQAASKFGPSLLRGFIFMVVVPAAIVVLCFTAIGFPIAIFSGLVYAAILMLACPFAVLFVSSLMLKKKIDLRWYHILFGAVIFTVMGMIPVIGWLVVLLAYLASLGSLIAVLRAKFKR